MRNKALGLLALSLLMAACGQSAVTSGPSKPVSAATRMEAEQADFSDTSDIVPTDIVDPSASRHAEIISDAAASQGQAVRLTAAGGRVSFRLPSTLDAGSYDVTLRSRAETLAGSPALVVRRRGNEIARVQITSADYQTYDLGSLSVQPGDRLSVVYTNDGSGAADSSLGVVVDYLNIDTGSAAALPAIDPVPPVVVPPVVTPPPVVVPPVVTPPPVVVPPPVVTPPPASTPPVMSGSVKLPPSGKVSWDLQIGAGSDSAISVPAGVKLLDVDGFGTSAAKVAQLKAQGVYTLCYIDVGSYEPGRPDSDQYPDYLKIQQDPDWPAEYFLDVTDVFKPNSVLASILTNRFAMCRSKGFDALDPDNLQNDQNVSGGRITAQQQLDFNGWVADAAHAAGLAVFQKNGTDRILLKDRTGQMMVEKFDGILNEQCQQYGECAPLAEYSRRGKLALEVEYRGSLDCTTFAALGVNAIFKDLGLTAGTRTACN